ncbi:NADPH oxidase 4-like [Limulus polyphemus]|uniref:NADPH oxidase 4-like n=1 Tax=Limulus polyphemus TaxID=6850 RepID=A0ABM1T0N5_LIMPO|nr:NADPH oxidase 4-like [Limulus polyphemus]
MCFRSKDLEELTVESVHFLWMCQELQSLLLFADLLSDFEKQMWEENRPDFIDIQLYLTHEHSKEQMQNLLGKYPNLVHKVCQGHPDWYSLFREWIDLYKGTDVGVFCCGPHALRHQLASLCRKANLCGCKFTYKQESFF